MTAILVFLTGIAVTAYTVNYDASSVKQQIISSKLSETGASDEQSFINGWLTENAGTGSAEWYALCLSKENAYDFSAYTTALEPQINDAGLRATERQRMAIAYISAGGTNIDVGALIGETWNGLGIMSEIYALILINSGNFYCETDETLILESLLARQHEDGGWSLNGNYSDPDVTAMAVQALSAYRSNPSIQSRIDCAVEVLSAMQQSDGGYRSYGTPNAESNAQVIIALCQLGIDPQSDGRFLKNGNSPVDALMSYHTGSGGFSHISGGAENGMAAVQAYEAFTAISHSGLYNLNEKYVDGEFPPLIAEQKPTAAPEEEPTKAPDAAATAPPKATEGSESGKPVVTDKPQASTAPAEPSAVTTASVSESSEELTEIQPTEASEAAEESSEAAETTAVSAPTAAFTLTTISTVTKQNTSSTSQEMRTETACTSVSSAAVPVGASVNDVSSSGGWKIPAYTVIAVLFAGSAIYPAARRQFSWKKLAASGAVCTLCAGAVFFMNIQTPEEYYSRNLGDIQPDSLTVTFSVSCEKIKDEIDGDYMIVPETELVLLEDDTVFDILERVLAYNKIPFDYNGSFETDIYIRGINNIYEMDHGEMSGWMYLVNGETPNVGCGAYAPEDGDVIEWVYTLEVGRDIGQGGNIE